MYPIKIMLVDDHKVIRDGIRSYLEEDYHYTVVAEASNGYMALEALKENEVDIVLIDINMDEMDGITATKEISILHPDVKVIAMTMLNENQHIKKMMSAGASGYLLKNCSEEEIKAAINTVMKEENYYCHEVTNIVMNNLSRKKKTKTSRFVVETPLTDREKEVLKLILMEMSNKEIASELFISMRTVDAHKRNLLEKTGARNLAGLALYAINKQLFEEF